MRKYKCKYDIEFQDIKEILDFMDDHYADKTAFIYKSKDRKSQTEISFHKFRQGSSDLTLIRG